MKKLLPVVGMMAMILAFGAKTAYAQTVGLDAAIQSIAAEFAPNIERGTSVAVIAIQADSVGMSNHLINGMASTLFGMRNAHGFEVASRGQIEMLMAEQELSMSGLVDDASAVSIGRLAGVQFIMTGTFAPAGDVYRFWAQLIEVETGFFRGISSVDILNDNVVSSLLGVAGREPPPPPPPPTANWFSAEITFAGVGVRYQRDINQFLSLGGTIFWNVGLEDGSYSWILRNAIGLLATARFFPFGLPLYLELGIGWGVIEDWGDAGSYFASGFMMSPALGVRLGGQRGGFFANPFVSFPVVFGEKTRGKLFQSSSNEEEIGGNVTSRFMFGIGFGRSW